MKEPVIAEVKIIPVGTRNPSLSDYVSSCIDILRQEEDVIHRVTAMGTIIQGPLERVLEITRKMHEVPFNMGAERVVTTISIDDRRDKRITIDSKVEAVTRKTG